MKKLNTLLQDEKVQGAIIVTAIFVALAVVAIATWDL